MSDYPQSDLQQELAERSSVPEGFRPNVNAKVTEKQRDYLKSLLERKDLTGVDEAKLDSLWKSIRISEDPEEFGLSKQQASTLIDWLLKRPDKPAERADSRHVQASNTLPDVPAGRYAVDNEDGVLRFYSVDKPNEGRWVGYTFVSVWASDERHPIKGAAARNAILQKIADAGPKQAAERFGQEIGACGICGRTLTDETSRSIGIGPICRGKSDWY